MTLENTSGMSRIPSHFVSVLRALVGHRIIGVTRYGWWNPEDTEQACGVKGQDVFSLTAGPVVIEFDTGMALGIASEPSTNSVSVWVEKNEAGQSVRNEPLASDEELHPISATNVMFADQFWRHVIGSKVNEISILVRKLSNVKFAELPNEVGLCFSLDSGLKIVAAHGLHDDSDDFAIIPDKLILHSLRSELQELSLKE